MDEIRNILEATIYCTIATVCDDGTPWNTPVFFGYDEQLNLYWRSWTENVHSRNLAERPMAFITVYDSRVPWGEGTGAYLKRTVTRLDDQVTVERGLKILDRRSPRQFSAEEFMGDNPRRFYKFTTDAIWRNVDGEEDGRFVDTRKEVSV